MSQILRAISKYLGKHNIKVTDYHISARLAAIDLQTITIITDESYITIHQDADNTITLDSIISFEELNLMSMSIGITYDIADPELFSKILKKIRATH
jgi:hypothetical protein